MGWNIGTDQEPTQMRRSYTSIGNLAHHCAHTLSGRDWRQLKPILQRASGDPFTVTPKDAAKAADLLDKAAAGMPANWAACARELATTARHAASTRQNWTWR